MGNCSAKEHAENAKPSAITGEMVVDHYEYIKHTQNAVANQTAVLYITCVMPCSDARTCACQEGMLAGAGFIATTTNIQPFNSNWQSGKFGGPEVRCGAIESCVPTPISAHRHVAHISDTLCCSEWATQRSVRTLDHSQPPPRSLRASTSP